MKMLSSSDMQTSGVKADHPSSVLKILDGALRAIGDMGARRLSMSDISEASGVSRGTLYRYFASKEDVLAAVSEFVCVSFEDGIRVVGQDIVDPIERFRAVMRFFARFTTERSPERIFEIEPAFHLDFFRGHFDRHKAAVRDALEPVLDHFDMLTKSPINRDGFVETLVRLQLSTLIVPASETWMALWDATPETLEEWALKIAGQPAQTKERMN
jgi:AcrR family transcriptional regulator